MRSIAARLIAIKIQEKFERSENIIFFTNTFLKHKKGHRFSQK